MPLNTIAIISTVMIIPVTHVGILKSVFIELEIEFPCATFPIPKDAKTVNMAKAMPKIDPGFLFLKPLFMVTIGPPIISPLAFTVRYFIASIHSANLEVRPKAADTHIHTKAPGPPATMAVATPIIFPVPIVAANAVINAEKGDTSPSLSVFFDNPY